MVAHTTSGLKKVLDSNDTFLNGHRIIKIRRHKRKIPSALRNDTVVQKLLLRSFPKMNTSAMQRWRAGRWARVIQLYFRAGRSYMETAEEMDEQPRTVEMIIRSIFRSIADRPCDGRHSSRKRRSL